MKHIKLIVVFLLLSLSLSAQTYKQIGNTLQERVIGSDTSLRFNTGASGFRYFPTTEQVKKIVSKSGGVEANYLNTRKANALRVIGKQQYFDIFNSATEIVNGSKAVTTDGSNVTIWSPDGAGKYVAFYVRDFTFTEQGRPDLVTNEELLGLLNWIKGYISPSNYYVPDHIFPNGEADYDSQNASRPVLDNHTYFINMAFRYWQRTGSLSFYNSNKALFDNIIAALPFDSENKAVYIPDVAYGQPGYQDWGFCDSEFKSGYPLFINVLLFNCYNQLAAMADAAGDPVSKNQYINKAVALRDKVVPILFDTNYGMFKASSIKSQQYDIWGSALAVYSDFCYPEQALMISNKLSATMSEWYWQGGVRHVATGADYIKGKQVWEAYIAPNGTVTNNGEDLGEYMEYGTYQNGGYWSTPFPWVAYTLGLTSSSQVKTMYNDVARWGKRRNTNAPTDWFFPEWWSPDGKYGIDYYNSSVTMPLVGVTGAIANEWDENKRATFIPAYKSSYSINYGDDDVISVFTPSINIPDSINNVGKVKTITNYLATQDMILTGANVFKSGELFNTLPKGETITVIGTQDVLGKKTDWIVTSHSFSNIIRVRGEGDISQSSSKISLFKGNDDYFISFDSDGGTKGLIRYNVDTKSSVHGHIFSAGTAGSEEDIFRIFGDRAESNVIFSAPSLKIGSTSGVGTRNVVASPDGTIGTTTDVYLKASDINTKANLNGGNNFTGPQIIYDASPLKVVSTSDGWANEVWPTYSRIVQSGFQHIITNNGESFSTEGDNTNKINIAVPTSITGNNTLMYPNGKSGTFTLDTDIATGQTIGANTNGSARLWNGESLGVSNKNTGDFMIFNGTNWINKSLTATAPLLFNASLSNLSINPTYLANLAKLSDPNVFTGGVNTFNGGIVTLLTGYTSNGFLNTLQSESLTATRNSYLPAEGGTLASRDFSGYKSVRTANGNGSSTTISIAHGLANITAGSYATATANNAASAGIQYVTVDVNNINIFYTVAPAAGTNNLTYSIEIKP